MGAAIRALFQSRRSIVAIVTAFVDLVLLVAWVFFHYQLGEDPDSSAAIAKQLVEAIATLITTVGGVLIAGYSVTDAATSLTLPAGVGRKDVIDVAANEKG